MGIGGRDWGLGMRGLGIGDWGLGIGDWAQSPISNPQSPIPIEYLIDYFFNNNITVKLNLKKSLLQF